ncbi:MAG TPA: hypothetical protein VN665_00840, partial [Candidatus Paceibacterota bacterium]|nr:hypothetical protein [Candidatus Paceibacterota bacterium]
MKKLFLTLWVLGYLLSGGAFAYAQTTQTTSTITPCGANCNLGYTPLEPIPGLTTNSTGTYDLTTTAGFSNLIDAIFKILISVGALLSVV